MTALRTVSRLGWLLAPVPKPFWIAVAVASSAAWFVVGSVDGPAGFDWAIYGEAFRRWQESGSPYQSVAAGWDPCREFPYLYPPSSWPLLPLAAVLPYELLALGALPLLSAAPRFGLLPVAAILLFVGLGPGLYLANINVLVVGLLALSFRPGRVGGLALALAVALKAYPIVLLPFLWGDRTRLRWFALALAALAASGTVLFGPGAWADLGMTLLRQGPHCDVGLNPLAGLGWWRLVPAALIAIVGWRFRSPTLALLGATLGTGVVTRHYLPTMAATLPHEPLAIGPDEDRELGWAR